MSEILKSSEEWQKELNAITVIDPDGWDRSNFNQSWSEPITEKEYLYRRSMSTCKGNVMMSYVLKIRRKHNPEYTTEKVFEAMPLPTAYAAALIHVETISDVEDWFLSY